MRCMIATALFSNSAVATEESKSGDWEFSWLTVSQLSLTSEALKEEPTISKNAMEYSFSADYESGKWLTSLGIGLQVYDDSDSWEQDVVDQFGNEDTVDSSTTGWSVSAAFGPRWFLGNKEEHMLVAQAGYAYVGDASRGVGLCTDCPGEDIDVEGGAFFKATYLYSFSGMAVGFHATKYLSGDSFDQSFGIVLSTPY